MNADKLIRMLRERDIQATIAWVCGSVAAEMVRRCEEAPTREDLDLIIAPLTDRSHPIYESLTTSDVNQIRRIYVERRAVLPSLLR